MKLEYALRIHRIRKLFRSRSREIIQPRETFERGIVRIAPALTSRGFLFILQVNYSAEESSFSSLELEDSSSLDEDDISVISKMLFVTTLILSKAPTPKSSSLS